MMKFRKKIWDRPDKSKTMISEVPECELQSDTEEFLDDLGLRYVHIPNFFFLFLEKHAKQSVYDWFVDLFGGRPDIVLEYPICEGIAMTLLMELKTQDKKGRLVGKLHGKQKHHVDDWVICRSMEQVITTVDKFIITCEKMKKIMNGLMK